MSKTIRKKTRKHKFEPQIVEPQYDEVVAYMIILKLLRWKNNA